MKGTGRDYLRLAIDCLVVLTGVDLLVSGRGGYRFAYTEGWHIRVGGALMMLYGLGLLVLELRRAPNR